MITVATSVRADGEADIKINKSKCVFHCSYHINVIVKLNE